MKKFLIIFVSLVMLFLISFTVVYADYIYTVKAGDSMWRIAQKTEVGLSELKRANPEIKNYSLIYPGEKINVPTISDEVLNYEKEVIRLINEIRASYGLNALKEDWELSRVARFKSQDMQERNYFSHTSPTYGSPFQMMKSFGIAYKSAAENIAKGYSTPRAVVDAWMRSSGHRANILNSSFTHIGVGYIKSGHYVTEMFISK